MIHILSSSLHREAVEMPFAISPQFAEKHQVIAVLTGGTENQFVKLLSNHTIDLKEPVYLVVSGQSNSLAASLEILTYIRQHGGRGIVVDNPSQLDRSIRLGVVGEPSDWLIASGVDERRLRERLNTELVRIPIEEITRLGVVDGGLKGAEQIYHRLKEVVEANGLDGVTLRCFDLLTTVRNTGCIALSKLNDDGIPAACEGDIPALITMLMAHRLTGCPGFQVNPAQIDDANGEMLFAHCTLPLKMTTRHELTTHFESGIGVAIHGELPTGDYTIVKISGDLQEAYIHDVQLLRNQYAPNLCRTQVWVSADAGMRHYFRTRPVGNHHVLVPGHHEKAFREWLNNIV
ncbi:MAG: hypothetical protein IKS01_03455 [Paludibacteraceae bacterium]|nr:hypothetical protein [Paludibacteraceae bacterium]